ncbi:MAG: MBL fold metallo-hydrolase [Burkholderiaceae bacterium]
MTSETPSSGSPEAPLAGADGAEALGLGLFAIDTGYMRARFDAVHLLVHRGEAMLVDTGTHHSVPRVLAAIAALGIPRDAVRAVALTHVHLDHAGGAGALMSALPSASLLVHPRGARHMIDPARLWAGTVAVYGEASARALYGELTPIDARRVRVMHDGDGFAIGGRRVRFIDAPGHALHHHLLLDEATGAMFTGDTFGIGYRELIGPDGPMVFPSSTPVQFDPQAMNASLQRILALRPTCVLLTHYSRHDAVAFMAEQLLTLVEAYRQLGERSRALAGGARTRTLEDGMRTLLFEAAHRHRPGLDDEALETLLGDDIRLNAAGLQSWLERA